MIKICAAAADEMDVVRGIFTEYMQSIAHLAATSFAHQRTDEELATLPGKYGPPHGAIVLAWDGNVCVGCAAVRRLDDAGTCELKRMYVKPSVRGRGAGRGLCTAIMDLARGLGYQRMWLDSDPELVEAQRLYEALGFAPVPRYNDDPDPDTLYLGREL